MTAPLVDLSDAEMSRLRIAVDHDETHGEDDYNTSEHLFAAVSAIVADRTAAHSRQDPSREPAAFAAGIAVGILIAMVMFLIVFG
jgi:hypothetical protein